MKSFTVLPLLPDYAQAFKQADIRGVYGVGINPIIPRGFAPGFLNLRINALLTLNSNLYLALWHHR